MLHVTRLLAAAALILPACGYDPALQGDIRFNLADSVPESHIEPWIEAAQQWEDAGFPYRIEFERGNSANLNQIHSVTRDEWIARVPKSEQDALELTRRFSWALGAAYPTGCEIVLAPRMAKADEQLALAVALHELGHCLGLIEHSNDRADAMYPTPVVTELSNRDVARLDALYR